MKRILSLTLLFCLCLPFRALALIPPTPVMPERRTSVAEIRENLLKIDEVRMSAFSVLDALLAAGEITQGDLRRRVQILNNAFFAYRFPWMTKAVQPYWTRYYGKKKDFVPGVVYYGMPYIQYGKNGSDVNRRYNPVNALRGGFYTDSGKGYYLLNQKKNRGSMYVGSDCSSFVGMSVWGGPNRNALMRTRQLWSTPLYRTLPNHQSLRPGDILVRASDHVFFFLYYLDRAKTRMVILEQGGGDESLDLRNTVSSANVLVAPYAKKYRPRRLSTLGK